jgi:transposase
MKLHRNAALSLKGRRELCRRVVERERTLSEAAEAAEVSARCARKWVARYLEEGERGLLDRSSGAALDPASRQRAAGPGNRGVDAVAVHRSGDRRGRR